mmetsp:Transcript_84334/g.103339  ORF Transcript_84334/g.103339 Transcript_84334/m.103339 type:complete len:307 (-) Transcript_84334:6-926(-)
MLFIWLFLGYSLGINNENCTDNIMFENNIFNIPIINISSPVMKDIIGIASKSFYYTNIFVIPNFIRAEALLQLQYEMLSVKYNKQRIQRTIFQDHGDLEEFPDKTHPRNHVGNVSQGHTNRVDVPILFENIYQSKYLLEFIEQVLIESKRFHDDFKLYHSNDREGAIYSLIEEINDYGSWHYDEHPISCVYMIHKTNKGGNFEYVYKDILSRNNMDWNIVGNIQNRSPYTEHYINELNVNEGDMYCFLGNETLHQVSKNSGNHIRTVIVMAYATSANFIHTENILDINFVDGITESKYGNIDSIQT